MRQRLASKDLSIEELLSGGYAFSIPAYQRDYTWTREEAIQLVDDLSAVIDDVERDGAQTPYFLGTMLFIEPREQIPVTAAQRRVEVVDGQQRLITLTILFAVLRDMAKGDAAVDIGGLVGGAEANGTARFHVSLRSGDEAFFRAAIQEPGASRHGWQTSDSEQSLARRNIEEVRRAIRLKLQRDFTEDGRQELVRFVRRDARVLVVSSDDFDYAYQIFLTINDRGKPLSVEDIFRGEILGPLDREQRQRYEAIIDEIEKYREDAEPNRTKGKTFFSHLATIDGWPRRGIIDGLKRAVEKRGGPRRFVADMFAPMAESYLQIKGSADAAPLPPAARNLLLGLRWLELHGDDDWVPLAMVGISRLSGQPDRLEEFLRYLDRYAHGLMALGCGRDARRKHYVPILKQLIDTGALPSADALFAFNAVNQKAILRNIATRLHLIDAPTAKLVLVRADQVLSRRPLESYGAAIERHKLDPHRFTVEHVCPKGQVREGEWLALWPRKTVRERAAQCIGNLALVTEQQNKRCSQKDFADKQRILFADSSEATPFMLTEMLREETAWDATAITRRYNLIMGALKELWDLKGAVPPCPALGLTPSPAVLPPQPPA